MASVDLVSESSQSSVLGPLLFILYTSELFRFVENPMVGCADDTAIYAVLPRLFLRPRVKKSLNQDLATIYSFRLMWHIKLNPKKTKSMMVSRSRTYAFGYGDPHTWWC